MILYRLIPTAVMLAAALACNQETKQKDADDSNKNGTNTDDGNTSDGSTSVSSSNDGYFTGLDGVNDYSLLLPRFREFTIEDPTIAKVESIKVTLSQATIDELIADAKAENPDFEDARFIKTLGREQTVYKITPLKAGTTAIKTSGGRGGKAGTSQSGWSKSENLNLTVTKYTAEQLEAGKKRYTTDGGGGNLRACKSCHETGAEGAPPHELGRIAEISDAGAKTWITTGKFDGRVAKIQHTWEFSSDEEENGIVAYLRSKQTHDVETLTKLIVEEQMANGGFKGGPQGN